MKKMVCCILGVAALSIGVICSGSIVNPESASAEEGFALEKNEQYENLSEAFILNQDESNMITGRFVEYLRKTYGTTVNDSVYTVNGLRAENYPSYFGGSYINTDGYLVIQIKDTYYSSDYKNSSWYHEFVEIVGSDHFYCHPVKYSYSELIDAISEASKNEIRPAMSGIDDYKNAVDVYFGDQYDYELAIDDFNSDIYSVSVMEEELHLHVDIYPGEKTITMSTGTSPFFSLACRVRRNNPDGTYNYGFLTCGHAFSGSTDVYIPSIYPTNNHIGYCYSFNQHTSGSADVAYITTDSTTGLKNSVYGENITLYPYYNMEYFNVGSYVSKRGAGTGVVNSGTIQTSSGTAQLDNYYFSDIAIANYTCVGGDSGGIVFRPSVNTGYAYTLGIHSGGTGSLGVFTKIYNDLAALQSGSTTYSLY